MENEAHNTDCTGTDRESEDTCDADSATLGQTDEACDVQEEDQDTDSSEDKDAVRLHFREIPKDGLTREHVIAILGPEKAKDNKAIEERTIWIKKTKAHLRQWAYEHLKKQCLAIARELKLKVDGDRLVSSFTEVVQWWKDCDSSKDEAAVSLNHILYGWFKAHPRWELKLERVYMKQNNLIYTKESVAAAHATCPTQVWKLKGCVAKTISYVKSDIVSRFQKAGKYSSHGMVLTMSRPGERTRNADGKYIKRKKGEFFITVHDHDDVKPKKKKNKREKVQCMVLL